MIIIGRMEARRGHNEKDYLIRLSEKEYGALRRLLENSVEVKRNPKLEPTYMSLRKSMKRLS